MILRKRKTIIIVVLILITGIMSLGYAILSKSLRVGGLAQVEGDWDIRITGITSTGTGTAGTPTYEGTSASFGAVLNQPGEYVEYEITVINDGNIDAILNSITPSAPIVLGEAYNQIIYTVSGIEVGNALLRKDVEATSTTFKVKAEFDPTAGTLPENTTTVSLTLILTFVQCGEACAPPPALPTSEDCFTIAENGTITSYDYTCGTDIIVPATIDGVQVQTITSDSFNEGNVKVVVMENQGGDFIDGIQTFDGLSYEPVEALLLEKGYIINNNYSYSSNFNITTNIDSELSALLQRVHNYKYYNVDLVNSTVSVVTSTSINSLDLSHAIYLTTIDSFAFGGKEITSVTFPDSLITIGYLAFYGNSLTTLAIPSNVNTIKYHAFNNNPSLSSITVNRTQQGMTLGGYWNGSATVTYNE